MSFLNSVLSSIGDGASISLPAPQVSRPNSRPNSRPGTAQPESKAGPVRNAAPASSYAAVPDHKRKADNGLSKPNTKALKETKTNGPSKEMVTSARPQLQAASQRPTISTSAPALPRTQRGSPTSNTASVSPVTGPAAASQPAPKKGSFAEIMARAKASTGPAVCIGVIKDKPKTEMSDKKTLTMQKKARKEARLRRSPGRKSISPASKLASVRIHPKTSNSSKKKPTPPSYRGTAASTTPKPQPSYRGTMKCLPTTTIMNHRRDNSGSRTPNRARSQSANHLKHPSRSSSQGSRSQASSHSISPSRSSSGDMEAGFSDVEEEESKATKFARKEDDEEARKEAEMKREKEARRMRLESLAKGAKKQAY